MGTRSASLQVVVSGAVVAGAAVSGAVVAFDPHADKIITATINKHINFHKLLFIGYSPPCMQKELIVWAKCMSKWTVRVVNYLLCLWPASNRLIFTNWTLYNSLRPDRCFFYTAPRFSKLTFRLRVFPKAPPPFLSQQAFLAWSCDEMDLLSSLLPSYLTAVARDSKQVLIP